MVTILRTDEIPDARNLPLLERLAYYNGLDTMLVLEVHSRLNEMMDDIARTSYKFSLEMQAPILDMMLNGTWIDQHERRRKILDLERKVSRLTSIINAMAKPLWGKPLNPASWQQKSSFFYNFLSLPPVRIFDRAKGEMTSTTNREAMEKLAEKHFIARPIALAIMAFMDANKALGTLKAPIDPDGFFRASYNIAGTETGRLSSKRNVFGRCSNDQNWAPELRSIFAAPMP